MITVDMRDVRQFESDLKTFAARAYPFATRWTLHQASKRGQRLAVERVRQVMTLRNKFTEKSIQFAPRTANGMSLNVNNQEARLGSTLDYMAKQEFGGVETAKGKEGLPIATSWAAGQEGANPRTKLPISSRKLQNIQLRGRRPRGKNRAQRNIVAAQTAIRSGNRYTFMDFGRTKGIFRLVGGSKYAKNRGWPEGMRVKMAYDLSRRSVRIPQHQWLYPATMATRQEIPKFYRDALLHQLKRHRVLGY